MSLWARRSAAPPPRTEERFSFKDWAALAAPATASGVVVTPETALCNAAAGACIRVLVTSAAYLPVHATVKSGRTRTYLDPQPQVVRKPSAKFSRRNWVAQTVRAMATDGNMYGQVVGVDAQARATQVEILPSTAVKWVTVDGVEQLHVNGKARERWPAGDIVHIPASAFMLPGTNYAMSPVELARESIGAGIAAERYGASFFAGGGHPSASISANVPLSEDQAKAIKESYRRAVNGQEPAVFGSNLTYSPIQIDPKNTQFIDLLRFEVEQKCRHWGVPPSMVYSAMSGQAITYANVSQADMQFLKYSLGIWLADVEDAWQSLVGDPIDVKFNVDALMRMDPTGRWDLHTKALAVKARTVNEVREYEDEDPFDGPEFDEPGVPTQLALPV